MPESPFCQAVEKNKQGKQVKLFIKCDWGGVLLSGRPVEM